MGVGRHLFTSDKICLCYISYGGGCLYDEPVPEGVKLCLESPSVVENRFCSVYTTDSTTGVSLIEVLRK